MCSIEHMPAPSQIQAERDRLQRIIDSEPPFCKPHNRKTRAWKDRVDRATEDLAALNRGEWNPEEARNDIPY